MKKSIIWLASYPKSGNTWMRIFLANYLMNTKEPMPINQVHRFGMGDTIAKTYHMVAGRQIDVNDPAQILTLRDKVLRGIVANNADVNFVKTHNIRRDAFGVQLIPEQYTRSSIYILRNPLDMVLSYARHHDLSVEQAVHAIGHSDNATSGDAMAVATFLGSWSEHVNSWTARASYPQLTIRYEDLLAEPEENFANVLNHIGIPVDEERLKRAIKHASFKEVKKQEKKHGFIEKSAAAESFFTSGKAGSWKSELAPELAEQIKKDHRATMKRYGYLDA
ncbi:sulfotransferase domain-containing protein [Roseovarius faecimaris]|uniref:Sulfotransferase domain-containing protein n=1 Tax=Roseovarius faecimaris TaxID=2494550 RepID=A0A6I6IRF3_9RHOB|nr:sulfotransferase domain-containing protein [Roseovarius faecimaris]QGX98802.1 sulfotransferase domain-containing protein [Roseovarius faecimaris]